MSQAGPRLIGRATADTVRALVRELIETAILALLIFLALRFSVQNYRVEGPSMQPTLFGGQHLMVNRLVYLRFDPGDLPSFLPFVDDGPERHLFPFHSPHRGEVVVFRFPDEDRDFVKRIIGVAGDTVQVDQGQVFLNGQPLDEPYVTQRGGRDMGAITVAEGSYFVLGDNRPRSDDSRPGPGGSPGDWRPVPVDSVIGRVWLRYWPWDQLDLLQGSGGP